MTRTIAERDWKLFRKLHPVALRRLCERILDEARAELDRPGKNAHERYLSLYRLLGKRDRDIARAFNDLRRSTALTQLGLIHSLGLITEDERQNFTVETREILDFFVPPATASHDLPRPQTEARGPAI